jgi:hypothetical protein
MTLVELDLFTIGLDVTDVGIEVVFPEELLTRIDLQLTW